MVSTFAILGTARECCSEQLTVVAGHGLLLNLAPSCDPRGLSATWARKVIATRWHTGIVAVKQ